MGNFGSIGQGRKGFDSPAGFIRTKHPSAWPYRDGYCLHLDVRSCDLHSYISPGVECKVVSVNPIGENIFRVLLTTPNGNPEETQRSVIIEDNAEDFDRRASAQCRQVFGPFDILGAKRRLAF